MKENRSFDHLLGELHASGQPATEAAPPSFVNPDSRERAVPFFHELSTCIRHDPGHQWADMHRQVDGGLMDGFVTSAARTTGTDGRFVMGIYGPQDLPFYHWLSSTFALSDRHFPSVRSGTYPNRDFLLFGTADGIRCTGCGYPSPSLPSLFDRMDQAGIIWGAYADGEPFDGALGWSRDDPRVHRGAAFMEGLREGRLPEVAFVDGLGEIEDEHPPGNVQVGEAWTRAIYEAAVASPLWPSLALIWTYDEAGGFADHVPPPQHACIARPVPEDAAFEELGVRVPLVVVSPYARSHHVSHVVHDHTAITRLIEAIYDLPALTARDANSDALLDLFDFTAPPALLIPPPAPAAGIGGCAPAGSAL
jgi:phospholipase C